MPLDCHFTPSGPTSGSVVFEETRSMTNNNDVVTWSGDGAYAVEGLDSPNPSLDLTLNHCYCLNDDCGCFDKSWSINLVPLDTDECNRP